MIYNLIAGVCGFIFGCGLTISQMVDANKILNFLDISGNWDPSLALVMLGAVVTTWVGYQFVIKMHKPELTDKFYLPVKKTLDRSLIIGSAIFGIGWGIAGYCPGPAVTALGLGIMDAVYFMIGMTASLLLYQIYLRLRVVK